MSGVTEIAKESGLKPDIVANVFETILSLVAGGDKIRVKGFGTFERKMYKGRTLVTPAVNDGAPIKYGDSFVLKFHQSQLAKRRINIVAKKAKAAEKAEKQAPTNGKPKKAAKAAPVAEPTKVKPPKADVKKKSLPPPAAKKKHKPAPAEDEE